MLEENNNGNNVEQSEVDKSQNFDPNRKNYEPLNLTSGRLVVIDQFLLANSNLNQDNIERFGGARLKLDSGSWLVFRDPFTSLFVICPKPEVGDPRDWHSLVSPSEVEAVRISGKFDAKVFCNTRCIVFLDEDLMENSETMDQYRKFWLDKKDKSARDMLRSSGCAVRYGFNRVGDDLGIFKFSQGAAMWPIV